MMSRDGSVSPAHLRSLLASRDSSDLVRTDAEANAAATDLPVPGAVYVVQCAVHWLYVMCTSTNS